MKYEQAFKIGSKIEGYIKCTYAQLFDYDQGKVFSLQKRSDAVSDARDVWGVGYEPKNIDREIQFQKDRPVVIATGGGDDMVAAVRLTDYARGKILQRLKADLKERNFSKERKSKLEYLIYKMDDPERIYYVKKVAIAWFPTDGANMTIIDPTTGQPILLSDALKEAEEKMDQAKKILLMTAGASIIL